MRVIKVIVRTDQGDFIADGNGMGDMLASRTKRQMVADIRAQWPMLFRDGTWNWHTLMAQPDYVLAAILNQFPQG
jgi:hypothetical protein